MSVFNGSCDASKWTEEEEQEILLKERNQMHIHIHLYRGGGVEVGVHVGKGGGVEEWINNRDCLICISNQTIFILSINSC